MGFDINKIFIPSARVDIILDMNSMAPDSRSSIVYDVDFNTQTITIAQPFIPFSRNTSFKELYLTAIIPGKNKKIRVGIECSHLNLIDQYPLANNKNVAAVLLKYKLPVKESNIRSAFRLPLSTRYIIKGKILYDNLGYNTSRDFSIRDISLTGIGIVVPKKKNNNIHPLSKIEIHEEIKVGIILVDMNLEKPVGTLPLKVQVTRINLSYSATHTWIGLQFILLKRNDENILNKFIHGAQIEELKRLSGRNL